MSQEHLAHVAGIDRRTIGRIESGQHQPTLTVLFSIAQAVHQTPQKLVAMVHREWSKTLNLEADND